MSALSFLERKMDKGLLKEALIKLIGGAIIVAALLVANAVWKTKLMKEEQQLLHGEKGVQA